MLKHIGSHNDRKVVVLFRQVPGEDHMCLIVYSDLLPRLIHDEVMRCLESAPGQQADNLADALHRILMADGRNALEVIHKEGFMKKVQTSQVIMTPTPATKIRLDELNKLLAEMALGADAVKRMAEVDSQSGLQNKKRDNSTPPRNVGEPANQAKSAPAVSALQAGLNDVLTDEAIAAQQLVQANRMRSEATSLLAEAARLESEAASLSPAVAKKSAKTVNTVSAKKTTVVKPATVKNKSATINSVMKATAKNVNTKETKKTKV